MPVPTLLSGPSFADLRERAVSRAALDASDRPGSVLLFEDNPSQIDEWQDAWRRGSARSALQLDTQGLASVVSRVHDRLGCPTPDVGTLERQRIIEQALDETAAIDDGRRYITAFSALFRDLEAHGILKPEQVRTDLADSELESAIATTVATVFERYCAIRPTLAHPHARPQSEKFLTVAESAETLTDVFPEVDHVVVSNYIDPAPAEVSVLEQIAAAFPTTVVVPSLPAGNATGSSSDIPRTTGTDAALSATVDAFDQLDFVTEPVPSSTDRALADVASRLYTPAATDDTIDIRDIVTWHEAPTPDREVRHVARHVRNRLATTETDPDDILVFAPGALSYRDRIEDVFSEFGIPHVTTVSVLLERTLAGRAILDALGLCLDPDTAQLERLATNPVVSIHGVDTTAITELSERLPSSDIAFLSAYADEDLRTPLADLLEQIGAVQEADGLEVVTAFGKLLDSLSIKENATRLGTVVPDTGGIAASPERAESRQSAGHEDETIATGYEERATAHVTDILESLVPVIERGVEDPQAELEHALQGVRIPAPNQPATGRIRIVGLEDTPMAKFSHLYILGATRDHLGGTSERPRYFQRIHEALGLPTEDRTRALDRYRFGLLLANSETVHVTTPAESIGGEDVLPSPMLEELATAAAIDRTSGVGDEPRGSREDVQRALAGASPDQLEEPLNALQAAGTCTEPQIASMRIGATTCANRSTAGLTRFDGQLPPTVLDSLNDDLLRSPYSPSRLNKYAQCGFKYYLDTGLDLDTLEEISLDAGRFAVGDVVHRALDYFYSDLVTDTGGPVDLDRYDRSDLEHRLLAAAKRARDDMDDDFLSPFDRHKLVTLFAGLATPESNAFYGVTEAGADEPRGAGLFVQILDRELQETDGHPIRLEAWFGDEGAPVVLENGDTLPIHGKIDRVDVSRTEDGGFAATVIDYKTYRTNAKDAVRGLDFQLPAYALGVQRLVEDTVGRSPDAVDAAFRVFQLPATVQHPQSLGTVAAKDLDLDGETFLSSVVPEWFEQLERGIESGTFQPAFIGPEDARCRHCDFAAVCDVRHHRRFEVMDALDEADHSAFVPPGSRPGDLADHVSPPGGAGEDR